MLYARRTEVQRIINSRCNDARQANLWLLISNNHAFSKLRYLQQNTTISRSENL
jgi:hypothetical protein